MRKITLISGIIFNLLILSYYKYMNFIIFNINNMLNLQIELKEITLPLAISFFCFQKIAFLIDIYRRQTPLPSFSHYSCFILFFPQLIAGPILRCSDFIPQLASPILYKPAASNLAVGSTIFIIGLFKKIIFADSFASISDAVFQFSQNGNIPSFFEAWSGILAFSLQIYFDFSGYSDMAIGLARLFNFKFPMNFNSPYKATSIIDFWRRWHISLSYFLRDYLYISLGGNKMGVMRRYFNLLATMLIGGLWHGASWTFVIWGGLHGFYLIFNHLLRSFFPVRGKNATFCVKKIFTFLMIALTWVFFRAESFKSAKLFFLGLFGSAGIRLQMQGSFSDLVLSFFSIFSGLVICFFFPNVYQWLIKYRPTLNNAPLREMDSFVRKNRLTWRPTWYYLLLIIALFFIAFGNIEHAKEFLYFQF